MKNILCYGDSNTYGFNPENTQRYDYNERYTGILQNLLGAEYHIIEEGLNSRTTVLDDPYGILKNGKTYLTPCIESHYPLDLVIIMLGTNDLKKRYHVPACDIAKGAGIIAKMVLDITAEKSLTNTPAKVLLVSPLHIGKTIAESNLGENFGYMRAHELSKKLAPRYEEVAKSLGIEFMDASLIAESSEIDALHLSVDGHKALAEAFAKRCIQILT
ncbi:MAG TPA: SGNH/GDSL hydrolase family protein [Clostridium sp.]